MHGGDRPRHRHKKQDPNFVCNCKAQYPQNFERRISEVNAQLNGTILL
jgi:hypothetical protein